MIYKKKRYFKYRRSRIKRVMDTLQVDSPEALACDGQRGEISDGTYIYSSIAENVAVLIGFCSQPMSSFTCNQLFIHSDFRDISLHNFVKRTLALFRGKIGVVLNVALVLLLQF